MNSEQVINVLVSVTLIELMITIGLDVSIAELRQVLSNWSILVRAMVANYVLVPVVTILLLLLFQPHPMVAAGFLILAVCPGAPYGPPFTAIAKGDTLISVGLMVVLAMSSAIAAPLLLGIGLPYLATDTPLRIDSLKIAFSLLVIQMLPLVLGICLRHFQPAFSARLKPLALLLSKILNLVAIVLILVAQFPGLLQIQFRGFCGMIVLLVASALLGWVCGSRDVGPSRAMVVTTSLRDIAVGLVIAAGCFPGSPAMTAVVSYGLVSLLGTLLISVMLRNVSPIQSTATGLAK